MVKTIQIKRRLLGLTFGHQLAPPNYEWLMLAYTMDGQDENHSRLDCSWHAYASWVEEEVWSRSFK